MLNRNLSPGEAGLPTVCFNSKALDRLRSRFSVAPSCSSMYIVTGLSIPLCLLVDGDTKFELLKPDLFCMAGVVKGESTSDLLGIYK